MKYKSNQAYLTFLIILIFLISNLLFSIPSKPSAFIKTNSKETTAAFTIANNSYVIEEDTFKIIDVSDKSDIYLLGILSLNNSSATELIVSGNYAYVIGTDGLDIINITDSYNPYIESSTPIQGDCYDIAIAGSYAYITSNDSTLNGLLNIVNISVPTTPSVVSSDTVATTAKGIAYNNYYVFVADYDSTAASLRIIDVSTPTSPSLEYSHPLDGNPTGIYITTPGSYAYAFVTNDTGLRIVNITNPLMPSNLGSTDGFNQSGDITVIGNYAYITDGENGIKVVNKSTLTNPFIENSLPLNGESTRINFNNSYLYVSTLEGGLRIVNATSTPSVSEEAKYVFSLIDTEDIAVAGYSLCTVNGEGLNIFDTSDPANLLGVGYYPLNNKSWGVAIDGNYAFIATDSGNFIKVDISNNFNPIYVGLNDEATSLRRIAIQSTYAYVADASFGLRVYDISSTTPSLIGNQPLSGEPFDVKVLGSYAFLACKSNGLQVVNISNPSSPYVDGQYLPPYSVEDIDISGNYAYLAMLDGGVYVIDISDPTDPQVLTNFNDFVDANKVNRILTFGENAYVGNKILNITNPNGILEIGHLSSTYKITSYAFIDPYLYFGNDTSGSKPAKNTEDSGTPSYLNTELPIGPEIQHAFYIDENKNTSVDSGDKLILEFDQRVNADTLSQSDFYLPNISDSLGSTGFNGYENTKYPTEVVLELGASPTFTIAGTTSSIDVDADIANTTIHSKRTDLTATDSGTRKSNDAGIDIKYVFIPDSDQLIGQSGGSIGVQDSSDATYRKHELNIPTNALPSDYTFNLSFPEDYEDNFSTIKLTSSPSGATFSSQYPATLTLEYLPESVDYDAGFIDKCMKVHQLVENPTGVFNFVLVNVPHTIDTVNHTVSVEMSSLNPNGSLENGTFGTIPIVLVDEDSITIQETSGKFVAEDDPILQPQQTGSGLYKKHRIEFPNYEYSGTGYTLTIRQAELTERIGFPTQSGAIYTIECSPTSFPSTAEVNITVQYIPTSDPNTTDCVTLDSEVANEINMKIVKRNPSTGDFEFMSEVCSVDIVNHTVTINNTTDFLDSGYATFGAAAEYAFSNKWDLFD